MEQATQIAIIERAHHLAENQETDLGGKESVVPAENYVSSERQELERARLFGPLPVIVGFSSQVKRPGDWITHDQSGTPLIILRGDDGILRAFVNACRHRGAHLEQGLSGRGRKSLVCPFHGWTYNSQGHCLRIPCSEAFPETDASQLALEQVPCGEACGLVFAVPRPTATFQIEGFEEQLSTWLGQVKADLDRFGLAKSMMINPSVRTRAKNWKLHMDVTQEIYHLDTLHRSTAGSGYFRNMAIHDWLKPHSRVVMPMESVLELKDQPPESWDLRAHAGIVYGIFPNTTLLLHSGYAQVLSTWPGDNPGQAVLGGGMLVAPGPVNDQMAHLRKRYYDGYWETMEEDLSMCESLQSSMQSGACKEQRFGRCEWILGAWHSQLEDFVSDAMPSDPSA